jgi:hypothetical protein
VSEVAIEGNLSLHVQNQRQTKRQMGCTWQHYIRTSYKNFSIIRNFNKLSYLVVKEYKQKWQFELKGFIYSNARTASFTTESMLNLDETINTISETALLIDN